MRCKRSSQAGFGWCFVSEDSGLLRESREGATGGAVLRVPLKDTQRALAHLHIREKLRLAIRALQVKLFSHGYYSGRSVWRWKVLVSLHPLRQYEARGFISSRTVSVLRSTATADRIGSLARWIRLDVRRSPPSSVERRLRGPREISTPCHLKSTISWPETSRSWRLQG
jgi:hypothetical protein